LNLNRVIYTQLNKDYAYWIEKRRLGQTEGGNVAGLLTHVVDGRVVQNILIDCGFGTMQALTDARGDAFWDEPLRILITHGHIDHHAELMVLSELYCQRRGTNLKDIRPPLAVYCTRKTQWHLARTHWYGYHTGNTLQYEPMPASRELRLGIFSVLPVATDHFAGAIWLVIQFGAHKILIAWDITTPHVAREMRGPSLALVEATTWHAMVAETTHAGIEALVTSGFIDELGLEYAPAREKYGAYLVHYSGWEDAEGMLTDAQLKQKFDSTFPSLASVVRVAERCQQWQFMV
jgi:hypothetical protein